MSRSQFLVVDPPLRGTAQLSSRCWPSVPWGCAPFYSANGSLHPCLFYLVSSSNRQESVTNLGSPPLSHTYHLDRTGPEFSRRCDLLRQHLLRSHVLSIRHGLLGTQDWRSHTRIHPSTIAIRHYLRLHHFAYQLVQGRHHLWVSSLDTRSRTPNHVDARILSRTGHWDTRSQLHWYRVLSTVK